jgi:nicotinic acid mononucleotide adenylyltransferase
MLLSTQHGYDVWGCYMSPVADAYGKQSLAPARHRLAMARLAAENSPSIMVDAWEAAQPGYTCTLQVGRRRGGGGAQRRCIMEGVPHTSHLTD